MENASYPIFFRIFLFAVLGLLIGASLPASSHAASSCSAQIQKAKNGAYEGCRVVMGNREYTIGAENSSEEGCSQVCSIMAEIGDTGAKNIKSAQIQNTFRE